MSGNWTKGCFGIIVAGGLLLSGESGASAGESMASFFAEQFGGGVAREPTYAPPVWADPDGDDRPLVVRPHRRKTAHVPRATQVVKGPSEPVSIYEDKTLRRGDAVMTAQGIRIFKGSEQLPYRDADFVAITNASGISQNVSKALAAIDRVPRS